MITKEWEIKDSDMTKPLIKRLLSVRGITKKDDVKDFLEPLNITLTHPNAFCDMQKAVDKIEETIKNNEKILIYGDFDADGMTSTSLLLKTLQYLGGDVEYFIPTRETESHGLNTNALTKLIVNIKPKLIITVDCGISNVKEVAFLNSFKKDIIITDHHEAPEILPEAYAIINPKAQNSLDERLTAKEIRYLSALAGVGVAFKLAQGILERFNKIEYSTELLPYVAVGTIADIVPLIGENRYYVLKGLDLISKGKHQGLKRLLEESGYNNIEDSLTTEQISFGVAPRLNASGRLDSVKEAITVLTSTNEQEINLSVMALNNYNKIRQELCDKTFAEAEEKAKNIKDNIIVLYNKEWHVGIIGIVASMIVEKYGKPVFLMTYSDSVNMIRCSARGVEGCKDINLYEIISNISDKLEGFGGHALAAGLYFNPEEHSFDEVKSALITSFNEYTNNKKPKLTLDIDVEIDAKEITEDLLDDISKLEPYGASNPTPTFVTKDFIIKEKKLIGSNSNHLRLTIEKDNRQFNALWWSHGNIELNKGNRLDLAYTPQLNIFNGNRNIQLIIKDIHSDEFNTKDENKILCYDDRKKTGILDMVEKYLSETKKDFVIFAENNIIINELKPYPQIYNKIINRNTLRNSDGIMFFDYPPTEELMNEIITTTGVKIIHYMHYDIDRTINYDYIKTMSGMIKYACNSLDGRFDLNRSACFMGITTTMIETLLDLFEDCKSISIDSREETYFNIENIAPVKQDELKNNENYQLFLQMLNEISTTRNKFLTAPLD